MNILFQNSLFLNILNMNKILTGIMFVVIASIFTNITNATPLLNFLKNTCNKTELNENEKINKNDTIKPIYYKGDSIVQTAMKYIGAPYKYGKIGPKHFDCSGFTNHVYKQENLEIMRTSRMQFTEGVKVHKITDLKKGDLVFFGGRRNKKHVRHCGIVTNVNKENGTFDFIHASTSRGVTIDNSNENYYSSRYIGARRIIKN